MDLVARPHKFLTHFFSTIVTPFTDTLADQNGLIPQIYALFIAEIITVSAIQLADPMGHVNRHVLAPRAATQDAMNLKFSGQPFELAERYTDMTKVRHRNGVKVYAWVNRNTHFVRQILFLCVWYCSIFPGSFFLCSFALLIKYFVDKFSLMRTWKRPPQLGTRVSAFSRRYFFSLACVAMSIISSFYWSGFPYDNICELDDPTSAYEGSYTVVALDESIHMNGTTTTFTKSETQYQFCSQDLMSPGQGQTFPFVASKQPEGKEWMTPEQEDVTNIFGWTSVVITAIVAIKFVWGWVEMAQTLFRSGYSVSNTKTATPSTSHDVAAHILFLSNDITRPWEMIRTSPSARLPQGVPIFLRFTARCFRILLLHVILTVLTRNFMTGKIPTGTSPFMISQKMQENCWLERKSRKMLDLQN